MNRHRRRPIVLGGLVAAGFVIIMIGAPAAQQQDAQSQPPAAPAGRGGLQSFMTGKITVGNTKDMNSSRIRFEAGARTNWHVHTAPQILLVEEGRGRWQEVGGDVMDIPAGQPVLTRANVMHWHGASPDQAALQFSVYSGMLEWKDAVTDDEYLGRKKR